MSILAKPMLTTAEVADRMRVNTSTVRRWRLDDIGPRFIRIGTIYRYPLGELEELARERVAHSLAP